MENEPIPVSLAMRAVERAIKECEAATPGPWELCSKVVTYTWDGSDHVVTRNDEDVAFAVLSRAGFRGTLEYLHLSLDGKALEGNFDDLAEWGMTNVVDGSERSAVAPLIAHYDRVSPGWREE